MPAVASARPWRAERMGGWVMLRVTPSHRLQHRGQRLCQFPFIATKEVVRSLDDLELRARTQLLVNRPETVRRTVRVAVASGKHDRPAELLERRRVSHPNRKRD